MNIEPKVSIIIPAYNSAEHISSIIDSVKAQSLTAFECIIINDGSADNTEEVVRALIEGDDRFRLVTQENQGVGAARNKGIEMASGKYIAFYDADDNVPPHALADLHLRAEKTDADLVIGRMLYSNLGEFHETNSLRRLGRKDYTHPFDRDLASNSSVCNKLFRRSVIIDNGLAFSEAKRYEDLLFCLQFEGKCNRITGCNEVVYTYERRPYWQEASAMMHNTLSMVEDMIAALDLCVHTIDENYKTRRASMKDSDEMAIKELDIQYERLRSSLYTRFVRTNFIDEVYRFAWTADRDAIDRIRELIPEYKKNIFPLDWIEGVREREADLPFEDDNILPLEELEKRPLVTFVVYGPEDEETLNNVVKGIYSQNLPLFEVAIRADLYDKLEPGMKDLRNMYKVDTTDNREFRELAYKACRGRYMWFIDRAVYLSRTCVKRMIDAMEMTSNCLFISAPIMHLVDGEYKRVDANAATFVPEFSKRKLRTEYNQLDYLWINKLFSVAKFDSMKEPFSKGDWESMDRFYVKSNNKKTTDLFILADITDEDVLEQVRSKEVLNTWKAKLKEEDDFRESLELRNKKEKTVEEKRKGSRVTAWKKFFRWATVKVIYPLVYALYKRKPVVPGKVLFVEPTQLEPTNSVKGMVRAVKAAGYDNIIQLSLAHNKVRRKEQLKRELRFIRELATAEYVFTTEALSTVGGFRKRPETKLVNLWHGCGAFKKFGFSTAELKFGGDLQEKLKYPDYSNADLITVSSPDVIWAYEEAMNYKDAGVVKATGISRTDIFYDPEYVEKARKRIHELVPEIGDRKVILYAPTFRGRVRKAKAPDKLDIAALNRELGDEYFLLIKHHPHVRVRPHIPVECRDFARDVTTEATIDDLLCCTDICISDYSSLVFEYSLFGKPMIFFAYDLEEYNDWRGFYYDYDELTPGPVVMSNEEIIRYVRNIDTEFDKDAVDRFRDRFMSSCDGHATQRILETIGMVQ